MVEQLDDPIKKFKTYISNTCDKFNNEEKQGKNIKTVRIALEKNNWVQ